MEKKFNVPLFVRYVDNLGNRSDLVEISTDINMRVLDWRNGSFGDLRPGDNLMAEVEVDPSFDEKGYFCSHYIFPGLDKPGKIMNIIITNEHVGEQMEVHFKLITHNSWHRSFGLDDQLIAIYRVLPPI